MGGKEGPGTASCALTVYTPLDKAPHRSKPISGITRLVPDYTMLGSAMCTHRTFGKPLLKESLIQMRGRKRFTDKERDA